MPKLHLCALGLFTTLTFAIAEHQNPKIPPDLPEGLSKTFSDSFPGGSVLVSQACRSGRDSIETVGALIQIDPPSAARSFEVVLAYRNEGQWKVHVVPRDIVVTYGLDRDFLRDFLGEHGYRGAFEIKCVRPNHNGRIGKKFHGEFLSKDAATLSKEVTHVCFSASNAYNSWSCFVPDPKTKLPIKSFAQLNAD